MSINENTVITEEPESTCGILDVLAEQVPQEIDFMDDSGETEEPAFYRFPTTDGGLSETDYVNSRKTLRKAIRKFTVGFVSRLLENLYGELSWKGDHWSAECEFLKGCKDVPNMTDRQKSNLESKHRYAMHMLEEKQRHLKMIEQIAEGIDERKLSQHVSLKKAGVDSHIIDMIASLLLDRMGMPAHPDCFATYAQ